MTSAKPGYLPTLDGWRAIAIGAVILDHVVAGNLSRDHPTLFALTRVGPNGVSLFFAISGFLICSRLLEEQRLTGKIRLRGFYIRRAFRILPPALAYLLIIGLLGLLGLIVIGRLEWWSAVFFFRNYLPPRLITPGWGGYTVHYWSLAVEEHFYLLWPGLLVLTGRKKAPYVAAGLALLVAVWRWWDFHHYWMERHIPGLLFGSRTDVRLDGLLMGCLGALMLDTDLVRSWVVHSLRWWMWGGCIALYAAIQVAARRHYYSLLESILLAIIVISTVLQPKTWFGRVLENPVLRWVGRLSYSLYLWQQLFALHDAKFPVSLVQWLPVNVLLLFTVAALSYWFLERPMIRLGHRLAPPPTPGREDLNESASASPGLGVAAD